MSKLYDLFSKVYRKGKDQSSYVLGILGSPRIGGNSDLLLDKALEGAQNAGASTEKIILNELKLSPCQECEEVTGDGTCRIEDDLQVIYPKIIEADVLILASPIFFGSLSAQTKVMIDRFQCHWRTKLVSKNIKSTKDKSGAFICVQASQKKAFFENARSIVKNFFSTVDVEYREQLFCPGIDEKAGILKFPERLEKAYALGQSLVRVK